MHFTMIRMGVSGVVLLIVSLFISHYAVDAHATTRGDIFAMNAEIEAEKATVKKYETLADEQKIRIASLEKAYDELKERERIAREWDLLNDTPETRAEAEKARNSLAQGGTDIDVAKERLVEFLDVINSSQVRIASLVRSISEGETDLRRAESDGLRGLTHFIGVDLSGTCKIMLKNGFTTDCPDMSELLQLDNSNPLSGKFGMHDGLFQRGMPLVKNDHELYRFDEDFGIIVNPSPNLASRIKMIVIEPSLDTYVLPSDMTKTDNTRTVNHQRYVHDCKSAVITAGNWKFLLPDTIHYLRTGCTITEFDEVEAIDDPVTEIDISSSRHWQEAQALEQNKIRCKGLCFEY